MFQVLRLAEFSKPVGIMVKALTSNWEFYLWSRWLAYEHTQYNTITFPVGVSLFGWSCNQHSLVDTVSMVKP